MVPRLPQARNATEKERPTLGVGRSVRGAITGRSMKSSGPCRLSASAHLQPNLSILGPLLRRRGRKTSAAHARPPSIGKEWQAMGGRACKRLIERRTINPSQDKIPMQVREIMSDNLVCCTAETPATS